MNMTEQQELVAREYAHKFAIVGAYLIDREVAHQTSGEITIPKAIAEEQAMKTVTDKIQQFLAEGIFDEMYQIAWEYLKDKLPEHFSIDNLVQN